MSNRPRWRSAPRVVMRATDTRRLGRGMARSTAGVDNVAVAFALRHDAGGRSAMHGDMMGDDRCAASAHRRTPRRCHRYVLPDLRRRRDSGRLRRASGSLTRVELTATRLSRAADHRPRFVAEIIRHRIWRAEIFRAVPGVAGQRRTGEESSRHAERNDYSGGPQKRTHGPV